VLNRRTRLVVFNKGHKTNEASRKKIEKIKGRGELKHQKGVAWGCTSNGKNVLYEGVLY